MSHDHSHKHSSSNIRTAFFINLLFSIIELAGGLYTNSVAILSDALHDFGDSLSLGVSWYFQKVAQRGRDRHFSYGYRRFSIIGAVINSIVLVFGSVLIAVEAIPRLWDPSDPDAQGMIWLALGGIIANGIAAWKLHGGHSLNERAVYLHLLEDVMGWTATLIAAVFMYFYDLPILDPLLALGISLFIAVNVIKNLKKAAKIMLQGTPDDVSPTAIVKLITELPEVEGTHDCHIWSMDGQYHILSIHVVVQNQELAKLSALKMKIKNLLKESNIDHTTIEFETPNEDCKQG